MWYNTEVAALRNGFVTEFTFRISDPTCSNNNCGGEGLAFVIQTQGTRAAGGSGHNIGYGKIKTSFAVEFDTNSNSATADPAPKNGRHISIIYKHSANLIDTPGKGG